MYLISMICVYCIYCIFLSNIFNIKLASRLGLLDELRNEFRDQTIWRHVENQYDMNIVIIIVNKLSKLFKAKQETDPSK